MTKTDWEKRFDKIGFGNQARIVGTKRVELKDFISQELKRERIRMGRALRMEKFSKFRIMGQVRKEITGELMFGYNKAVVDFNQAIDNYLKNEGEVKLEISGFFDWFPKTRILFEKRYGKVVRKDVFLSWLWWNFNFFLLLKEKNEKAKKKNT